MNSLLKSKPKSNTKKVFVTTLIICVVLVSTQYIFPKFISGTAFAIARPAWFLRDALFSGASSFFSYFSRIGTLQSENEKLRNDIYELRVKEYEYDQVINEYQNLKKEVGIALDKDLVFARVISKPPFTPYDTFIIDKGSEGGVRDGDFAYLNNILIIGKVTKVSSSYSVVTLFSSGDQEHQFVVRKTGLSVLVTGKGGGNFEIFVPKDFDIEIGDILTEPSHDDEIVAEIYAINSVSQNSFKRAYARVPQSIFQSKVISIGHK